MSDEPSQGGPKNITPKEYALMMDEFRPLFEPIGALIIAFSRLEDRLTSTIDMLSGLTPPEGWIYEALMINFSVRIQLFHSLALIHTRDANLRDRISGLVSRLNTSNARRNNLVHGDWTYADTSNKTFTKVKPKAEAGLKQITDLSSLTIGSIWRDYSYIFKTQMEIEKWRSEFSRKHFPPGAWRAERFPLPQK
jgi:hypothetical protein